MRVSDLVPGDVVWQAVPGVEAIFVQRAEHPLYPGLQLVVWRMNDGTWSHDALAEGQDVGNVTLVTTEERTANLRRALLHPSMWGDQPSGRFTEHGGVEWIRHDLDEDFLHLVRSEAAVGTRAAHITTLLAASVEMVVQGWTGPLDRGRTYVVRGCTRCRVGMIQQSEAAGAAFVEGHRHSG